MRELKIELSKLTSDFKAPVAGLRLSTQCIKHMSQPAHKIFRQFATLQPLYWREGQKRKKTCEHV